MKTFRDEIVELTKFKKKSEKIMNEIKDKIRKSAEEGYKYCFRVYKLKTENKCHYGITNYEVTFKPDVKFHPEDQFIIKQIKELGLDMKFMSVDTSRYPEIGHEGYSAAYFIDVSWERYV